jgi:hypothetical protein
MTFSGRKWGRSLGRYDDTRIGFNNTCIGTNNQDILDFLLAQRKEGRADETIRTRIQALKQVAQTTDLTKPEKVKEYLANSNGATKQKPNSQTLTQPS